MGVELSPLTSANEVCWAGCCVELYFLDMGSDVGEGHGYIPSGSSTSFPWILKKLNSSEDSIQIGVPEDKILQLLTTLCTYLTVLWYKETLQYLLSGRIIQEKLSLVFSERSRNNPCSFLSLAKYRAGL